jgi:LuxR family maltose regulon positive regulatory protein
MTTELLATKLYVPPVRPEMVSRPRLIQRLNSGLHRKLTLISAPAGFGKTTLLAEWLRLMDRDSGGAESESGGIQARSYAWLSLDQEDNDPARFITYLAAALETILEDADSSEHSSFSSLPHPPTKADLTILINDLAAVPADFVIVLDDYHVIQHRAIDDALTFLLDHRPRQMHLVIASRSDPLLPLARMRARGQLNELRAADLRFTPDEAAAFLNQTMRLGLSSEDISALEARTEGWITGLQLAAVALQSARSPQSPSSVQGRGAMQVASGIPAFGGTHRHVIDYLAEEVMAQQPDDIHDFLCETSILDRLTAPLCDAVTGRDDGAAVLEHLERANLFLIPLDNRRNWYRYHRLFADFLRNHLRHDLPHQVSELHRRAADWYQENKMVAEAIEHALAAEDYDLAVSLIKGAAEATLMRSQVVTFEDWMDALPDDVIRAHPTLCLYHAWAMLVTGHPLDEVEARLREAERHTKTIPGGVVALRAFIASLQGQASSATELSRQALEQLPQDSLFRRSLVASSLTVPHVLSGDAMAASRAWAEVAHISQQAGNTLLAVFATCQEAEEYIAEGKLRQAEMVFRQALDIAKDEQGRPLPIRGLALIGLGELSRERNDLQAAAGYLTEGIELTIECGGIGALGCGEVGAFDGYIALARTRQVLGDVEGALELIETARQLATRFDVTELDDLLVAVYQVRLDVSLGDLAAATRLAEQHGLGNDIDSPEPTEEVGAPLVSHYQLRELKGTALVRLWIARGQPDRALKWLEALLPEAEGLQRTGSVIEILMLQALARHSQGDTRRALTALERALSLAEPEGYLRIFVDEGPPMQSLLSELIRQLPVSDDIRAYIDSLLSKFDLEPSETRAEDAPESQSDSLSSALIEPLSDRELEVLKLIAQGFSNSEIAESLVVAISTVKTHINNIYRKLDVSKRIQAVQRARELNLL